MTAQNSLFESFYPTDWSDTTQLSQSRKRLSHPVLHELESFQGTSFSTKILFE